MAAVVLLAVIRQKDMIVKNNRQKMKLIKNIIILFLLFSCGTLVTQAQELTKEEKRANKKQVRLCLKKTIALYENSQLDSAYMFMDSVLKIEPKNSDGFYYKGLIELKQNDTTKADSTLTQGALINPLSTRIKLLLSRIKLELKDFQAAGDLLDAILKVKPNEPETLYLRGLTYLYQNDSTNALKYLQNGLEAALE